MSTGIRNTQCLHPHLFRFSTSANGRHCPLESACAELQAKGKSVAHAYLRYIRPFPKNLGEILKSYDTVLIPEINNGQLIKIIRDVYFVDAKGYNKIKGVPITKGELIDELRRYL